VGHTYDAYIVDWDALLRAAASGSELTIYDPEHEPRLDLAPGWGTRLPATRHCGQFSDFGNSKVDVDACTQYDRLRDHLDEPVRRAWDEVLGALFWWGEEGGGLPRFDLPLPRGSFTGALSPESVRRCEALLATAPLSTLATAHDTARSDPRFVGDFGGSRWLPEHQAFEAYMGDWVALLRNAAELGCGVVLQ
jgi:hypothetical protein